MTAGGLYLRSSLPFDDQMCQAPPALPLPPAETFHVWRIPGNPAKLAARPEDRHEPVQSRQRQDNPDHRKRGAMAGHLHHARRHPENVLKEADWLYPTFS